jgi:hypothetical protein
MDLESIGASAGSGIVGIVLGYFGISKRMDKMESDLDKKVAKEVCERCKEDQDKRLDRMENKIDLILEKI